MKLYVLVTYSGDIYDETAELKMQSIYTNLRTARKGRKALAEFTDEPLAIVVFNTNDTNPDTGNLMIAEIIDD